MCKQAHTYHRALRRAIKLSHQHCTRLLKACPVNDQLCVECGRFNAPLQLSFGAVSLMPDTDNGFLCYLTHGVSKQ